MIRTARQIIEKLVYVDNDKLYDLTEKKEKSLRSIAQNKYYFWVILDAIMDFIWLEHKFEKLELHKEVKDYFELETTTNLDPKEFSKMCNEIRDWYLENRWLYIPLPNEVEDLKSLQDYLY